MGLLMKRRLEEPLIRKLLLTAFVIHIPFSNREAPECIVITNLLENPEKWRGDATRPQVCYAVQVDNAMQSRVIPVPATCK
jgi:hypothetical protein